jgi:hypothetical protein
MVVGKAGVLDQLGSRIALRNELRDGTPLGQSLSQGGAFSAKLSSHEYETFMAASHLM